MRFVQCVLKQIQWSHLDWNKSLKQSLESSLWVIEKIFQTHWQRASRRMSIWMSTMFLISSLTTLWALQEECSNKGHLKVTPTFSTWSLGTMNQRQHILLWTSRRLERMHGTNEPVKYTGWIQLLWFSRLTWRALFYILPRDECSPIVVCLFPNKYDRFWKLPV